LSYPELYSDERVVLQAQNVKVKSVLFEVVLTTRRLVLIDSKKNSIPPQEINLATLKDVESGENAIRDPTITISIITISGNTRQMVLTFSKISGGERRREADDWVRALRQNITSTVYHPVTQVPVPKDIEPAPSVQPPAPQLPTQQPAAAAPHRIEITNTPPPKKRIEIARPMKKITEAPPSMPVPVETSSLPTGSFCNRCGNRVPPDSAFCNRCGTPVVKDTGSPGLSAEDDTISFEQSAPAVPQVQVTPSPVFPSITDKKDRPIEEVIHSIEPLIEDSVPRTAPAPIIPAKQTHYPPAAETAESADQVPAAGSAAADTAAPQPGQVQWPVLSRSGITDSPEQPAVPVTPPVPGSPPPAPPSPQFPLKAIAVLVFLIIVVFAAGLFYFTQGHGGTPGVTPTPVITAAQTTLLPATLPQTTIPTAATTVPAVTTLQPVPTAEALVPTSGVWVKVTYNGKYTGYVGTPNYQKEVIDTGNHLYQISTTNGPVAVSIQKYEGSSDQMVIDVYKDGTLMKHATTSAPKGVIEFQASVTMITTATP
jgi:zinc-ribbon domain